MSNNKKSTKGTSEQSKQCVKKAVVTNQFQKMMEEALKATQAVLAQRKIDLSTEGWNDVTKAEFYKIFGIAGDTVITIDTKEEKDKAIAEDPKTERDPYIEKRTITAYKFMRESVDRLIEICKSMTTDIDQKIKNTNIVGSFINETDLDKGSARVTANQTILLSPDKYTETLKVFISNNFVCKNLYGFDSMASTLCHEASHFFRDGENGKNGGMGTDDMPTKGGFQKDKNYYGFADELKNAKNQNVFKNSYNIERYFEITP